MTSTRLVSFTQRAVAAIAYEVEPLDGPARVVLQSELVANEQLPAAERATRGWPPCSTRRWSRRSTTHAAPRLCWCTGPGAAGCGWRPRPITWSTAPDGVDVTTRRRSGRTGAGSP